MTSQRQPAKRRRINLVILPLVAASVSGCMATGIKPVPEAKALYERVPKVENSSSSPCWQQQQIAKQQAFLHAAIEGKVRVFYTACGHKETAKTS